MAEPYTKCADAQCELDQYFPSRSNRPMNGSSNKIEIFTPFGEAFELMKKILFQPFDLKKWLVIGFTAWLASLGAGGGSGFNYEPKRGQGMEKINETISQIPPPILVMGIVLIIFVVVVLIVV